MKIEDFLLLLWTAVAVAAASFVINLVGFPLWFGVILFALSVVVAFGVSFVVEQADKWKQHRRKIKRLLDADKAKTNRRNRLQSNQLEITDDTLSESLADIEAVKEEVESIRQTLLGSIEYEELSIVKKQQNIESYKQLLKELEEVNNNGKNNKETKTL